MLDTGASTLVPPQESVTVKFAGRGGIPVIGASAVQMNIVTISPTATGNLYAWPTGETVPVSPNFYFYANSALTSSSSMVRLSSSGEISFKNGSAGTVRIWGDVTGYYTAEGSQAKGNRFVPLKQARVIDTRNRIGVTTITPVPANDSITVPIASKGGLPAASSIKGVVVNVTASAPTLAGGWTLYPGGSARPSAYHGNFVAQKSFTNSAVVTLPADGRLTLFNVTKGTTHYTVDVIGYFTSADNPLVKSLRVVPVAQQRILDTGGSVLVNPNGVKTLPVAGKAGLPDTGVAFAALRVTTYVSTTATGEIVTYPSNETRPPTVTDVAPPAGKTLSFNLMWARVSPDGTVSIVNGTNVGMRLYVDVQGYAVAPRLPEPPVDVTGIPKDRAAEVRWQPAADSGDLPVTGYEVVVAPGGATMAAQTSSVVFQGLANGSSYIFKVRTKTAAGWSGYSAGSDPVKPAPPQPPGAPFITSTLARDGSARVTWAAPQGAVDQVATYRVSTSPAATDVTVPGNVREATLNGLMNNQSYRLVVTAINANGSTASQESLVTPAAADVPLRPAALTSFQLDTRLDLQWVRPADGGAEILDYEVVADPGGRRLVTAAGTTVAALTGLANGTAYKAKVRARNKAGYGEWAEVSGTPEAARAPAPPTDLQASPTLSGVVQVAWEAPIDVGTAPVAGYRVTVNPGGRVVAAPGLSVVVDGLDPATEYTFAVQALNTHGASTPTPASTPIKPAVSTKKTPVILTAESMSRIVSIGGASVSISNPNAQLSALKADDIFIASASQTTPEGLLRKVLRVDDFGSVLVLQTTPAAMDEVFSEGAFSKDLRLTNSDVNGGLREQLPGVVLREPTIGGRTLKQGAPRARVKSSSGGPMPTLGVHDGTLVVEVERDFGRNFRTEVTAELTPSWHGSINFNNGTLNTTFKAEVESTLDSRLDVAVTVNGEQRFRLGQIPGACIAIPVGAAPVVACMGFEVYLTLESEGRAGISVTSSFSRRVGMDLESKGANVSAKWINDAKNSPSATIALLGSTEHLLGVEGAVVLRFYGAVGPLVQLKPYIRAEVDTANNPFFQVVYGIEIGAGLTLDVFSKNLVRWTKDDLLRWESAPIIESDGPFAGLLIDPPSTELAVGEQVDLESRVEGYPDVEPVEPTWSVAAGPGSVTSTGIYKAVADGTVRIKATLPEVADRPALEREATIMVGPHAPSQPRNVKALPGNLSGHITWDPPGLLGGRPIDRYVVTTVPDTGSHEVSGTTTSAIVGGLQAGVSYVASVYAVTSNGTGPEASSESFAAHESLVANPTSSDLMAGMAGKTNRDGAVISDSGRYAFFPLSVAPDDPRPAAVPKDNNFYLVRRDLLTGQVVLASRKEDGVTAQAVSPDLRETGRLMKNTFASSGDGRHVAYAIAGAQPRERVLVYDFARNSVWASLPGVPDGIEEILLTAAGDTLVLSTVSRPDASGTDRKQILRVAKGAAAKRIDICLDSLSCGRVTAASMSADGSIIAYAASSIDNQSQYYNKYNLHVFYDAASGASTLPYFGKGGLSFSPVDLSSDGQYFIASANLGDPIMADGEWGMVTKKVGTGPVTLNDAIDRGYLWYHQGTSIGISDGGRIAAWLPGKKVHGEPLPADVFALKDRSTGVRIPVRHPPFVLNFGVTAVSMASNGSVVSWMPAVAQSDEFLRPVVKRIR